MDGRTELMKTIKKRANLVIGLSVLLYFLGGLLCLGSIPTDNYPDPMYGLLIFGLVIFAIATVFVVMANKMKKDPENSIILKGNKQAFAQIDEVFRNKIYEDKDIIMSQKTIANKHNLTQVAYLEDVCLGYMQRTTYNFVITVGKQFFLQTPYNIISLNIYLRKKEDIERLINMIAPYAPNMRLGYSPENLSYFANMKEQWKSLHP